MHMHVTKRSMNNSKPWSFVPIYNNTIFFLKWANKHVTALLKAITKVVCMCLCVITKHRPATINLNSNYCTRIHADFYVKLECLLRKSNIYLVQNYAVLNRIFNDVGMTLKVMTTAQHRKSSKPMWKRMQMFQIHQSLCTPSNLQWSFLCFSCCFHSAGVYSDYTSPV